MTVEDIPVSAVVLPSVAITGAGAVTALAPSLTFQEILLAPVALTGEGVFSAAVPALTQVSITLPSVALAGEGVLSASVPVLTPQIISLPATAITGAGVVTAAATRSWIPSDVGSTKLRLWLRPEGDKYTTSARSVLETGTGAIGSWTDESGNTLHANQVTSGNRPSRRANGGILFAGANFLNFPAVGAWAANYVVALVGNSTAGPGGVTPRLLSVDDAAGVAVNQVATPNLLVSGGEGAPNYGTTVGGWTLNAVHTLLSKRTGTVHSISVDGAAPVTSTVPSSALTNNAGGLGYSPAYPGNIFMGHIHEVIIHANPTPRELAIPRAYLPDRKD